MAHSQRFLVQCRSVLGAPTGSSQRENVVTETFIDNVAPATVVFESSRLFSPRAPSIPTCSSDLTSGLSSGLTADICSAFKEINSKRFLVQSRSVLGAPTGSPQQENAVTDTFVDNAAPATVVFESSRPFSFSPPEPSPPPIALHLSRILRHHSESFLSRTTLPKAQNGA
jgi:hypothetical protein